MGSLWIIDIHWWLLWGAATRERNCIGTADRGPCDIGDNGCWRWHCFLPLSALIYIVSRCFKMFQVSIPHFSKRDSAMDSTDEGGLSALAVEYAPFESFWHFWLVDSLLMLELHQVSLERWELQQNASDLAEGGQKHDQRVMRVMCSIVSRYFLFILTYWFYWDTMGY
jgi:hypothetical protein